MNRGDQAAENPLTGVVKEDEKRDESGGYFTRDDAGAGDWPRPVWTSSQYNRHGENAGARMSAILGVKRKFQLN